MQYSILLAIFAASGAIALPQGPSRTGLSAQDILVELTEPGFEGATGSPTDPFKLVLGQVKKNNNGRPYKFVKLTLGSAQNQALRCQILDRNGKPILLKRGQNIDTTFAQGNAWAFENPKEASVTSIVCKSEFKQNNQNTGTGTGTGAGTGAGQGTGTGTGAATTFRINVQRFDPSTDGEPSATQRPITLGVPLNIAGDRFVTSVTILQVGSSQGPNVDCTAFDSPDGKGRDVGKFGDDETLAAPGRAVFKSIVCK